MIFQTAGFHLGIFDLMLLCSWMYLYILNWGKPYSLFSSEPSFSGILLTIANICFLHIIVHMLLKSLLLLPSTQKHVAKELIGKYFLNCLPRWAQSLMNMNTPEHIPAAEWGQFQGERSECSTYQDISSQGCAALEWDSPAPSSVVLLVSKCFPPSSSLDSLLAQLN